ncbi:hypothetical protein ACLKMH_24495 [Psychromonas sp. KJ10-10]
MEYIYVLITAWSINKINFCESTKELGKASLAPTLFKKLAKKVKK